MRSNKLRNLKYKLRCQNMGIPRGYGEDGGSRCLCSPGRYSTYCQMGWAFRKNFEKNCETLGGLRPPNSDNLDINYRSLIIIFSTKMSMKPYFDIFMQNINSTVTKLMVYCEEVD